MEGTAGRIGLTPGETTLIISEANVPLGLYWQFMQEKRADAR